MPWICHGEAQSRDIPRLVALRGFCTLHAFGDVHQFVYGVRADLVAATGAELRVSLLPPPGSVTSHNVHKMRGSKWQQYEDEPFWSTGPKTLSGHIVEALQFVFQLQLNHLRVSPSISGNSLYTVIDRL